MIKKILIKSKPLIIKLLQKIESLENKYVFNRKKSFSKEKVNLPDWLIVFIYIFCVVVIYTILHGVDNFFFIRILALILLVFVFWLSTKFFFDKLKQRENFSDGEYKKELSLFLTLSLLCLIIFFIFSSAKIPIYFVPLFGFALLISLLLNEYWALVFSLSNAIVVGYIFNWSFESFLYSALSCLNILRWSKKIYSRKEFTVIIFRAGVINFFIATSLTILSTEINFFNKNLVNNIYTLIYGNLVGVVLSWVINMLLLSPFELIYDRTTNIKLVELSNFENPLLKKLVTETPGTYHHSMVVSSLSEQVAKELKANSLLCKVAGFYHDIGKMIKPEYFIENQVAIQNPHRKINVTLSALVIISHVKEGVKLAEQYKLDRSIIDIIQQHHGTSIIHGIYEKTLTLDIPEIEKNLRYPGPKPRTVESAIIMISDSCEAACRGINEPDVQKIKETVERVINTKFVEGQLDECPLTLRDLYKMANIITQMLVSFYHVRTTQP